MPACDCRTERSSELIVVSTVLPWALRPPRAHLWQRGGVGTAEPGTWGVSGVSKGGSRGPLSRAKSVRQERKYRLYLAAEDPRLLPERSCIQPGVATAVLAQQADSPQT